MSRRLRRSPRLRRSTVAPPDPDDRRVRLQARGPADLLALIPFSLGFHPSESVVAVFVRGGGIGLVARIDLAAPSSADAFAANLRSLARRNRAEEIVLFAYSEHAEPARALLSGVVQALPRQLVRDALYVDGSRWWSMTCDQACCPADGTPYDVEGHRLAAEAVFAGMTTRASRAELASTVAGPPEAELGRLTRLLQEVRADRLRAGAEPGEEAARLLHLIEVGMPGWPNPADSAGLDDRACAELALLVADIHLRDLAWAMINPDNAEEHLAVWLRVVRNVLPTLAAAPLALAGMAGWISGNGALLNCAVDELLRDHPTYSMGRLLATISEQAIPPKLWSTISCDAHDDLRRELARLAG